MEVIGPLALAQLVYNVNTKSKPQQWKPAEFNVNEVIDYFSQQLTNSIKENDLPQIQTYIIALGESGHSLAFQTFESYLEGKHPVTKYQRLLMVTALSRIAEANPSVARSVLYKIYSNTQELDEIRVAAFYNLVKTNPDLPTWLRIAQFTGQDQSDQVNSAVVSTIKSLANLKQWPIQSIPSRARYAKTILAKNKYNPKKSHGFYADKIDENNTVQKFLLEVIKNRANTLKYIHLEAETLTDLIARVEFGVSHFNELVEYVQKTFQNYSQNKPSQIKTVFEKISRAIGLQSKDPEPLEGYVYTDSAYGTQFYPFDKNVVEKVVQSEYKFYFKEFLTFKHINLISDISLQL